MFDTASTRIAVIGGGKMGEAIFGGWIAAAEGPAAAITAENIIVANPGTQRRDYLSATYGVSCVADASEITAADIVVLAVKPQKMDEVLTTLHTCTFAADALYISIAAGLTTERLESGLPSGVHLVRTMPNTPLLVGKGATAVCAGANATSDDLELVRLLFSALGTAVVLDEMHMDAIGAVSGSGPAYVAAMIEALADAGAAAGLDRDLVEQMATATVLGTATLMTERGQSAEKTRIDVCSPGGTTLAALDAMNRSGLAEAYKAGIDAAITRSKELAAC